MKSRFLYNSTKKSFMSFFTVTLRPFIKHHSPSLFRHATWRKALRPTHSLWRCQMRDVRLFLTALISTILALSMKFQTSLNPLPPFSPPQTHTSIQKGCKKHVAFVFFFFLLTSYMTPINGYFRNYFVIIKGNFKSTFVVLYLLRIHINGLS